LDKKQNQCLKKWKKPYTAFSFFHFCRAARILNDNMYKNTLYIIRKKVRTVQKKEKTAKITSTSLAFGLLQAIWVAVPELGFGQAMYYVRSHHTPPNVSSPRLGSCPRGTLGPL